MFIYILCLLAGSVTSVLTKSHYALSAFIGVATLYCIPSFWILATSQTKKEGFQDARERARGVGPRPRDRAAPPPTGAGREIYDVIGGGALAHRTLPTAVNPFMNVLIDEIKYNPTRPVATSILDPSVKVTLDDFFRTEFNSDPTDVFGKTQSQRQFVAMPSTGIPNDQESYQNWLYRIPGKTCKEGGREACLPGTDGGALPWLNSNP
jgi:hypothetical protein